MIKPNKQIYGHGAEDFKSFLLNKDENVEISFLFIISLHLR